MTPTRDHELWALALWVERNHAEGGHRFIETRILALTSSGEPEGARLWRRVAARYRLLRTGPIPIRGQAETQAN